jgi:hypothetical protein
MVASAEQPRLSSLTEDSDATARRKPATGRSLHPDQAMSITMNATGPTDAPGPNPALMSALTTEH